MNIKMETLPCGTGRKFVINTGPIRTRAPIQSHGIPCWLGLVLSCYSIFLANSISWKLQEHQFRCNGTLCIITPACYAYWLYSQALRPFYCDQKLLERHWLTLCSLWGYDVRLEELSSHWSLCFKYIEKPELTRFCSTYFAMLLWLAALALCARNDDGEMWLRVPTTP